MHCTHCGSQMADDAKFCPACGTAAGGKAPAAPKPKAKGNPATGCLAIAVLAAIVYFAFGTGGNDPAKTAAKPIEAIGAPELYAAYDANEAGAQARFDGKRLQVTGTIESVALDVTDDAVIHLESANKYQTVSAKMADESKAAASRLSKGETVTVTCDSVMEVIGIPILSDCRL